MYPRLPTSSTLGTDSRALHTGHKNDLFLGSVIALTTIGVAIFDQVTPLGIAVWIGFLLPVSLSLGLWRPGIPLLIAAIATLLIIYAFFADAPLINRDVAAINRALGILTIWIMGLVGFFFIRNRLTLRHQQWLQAGLAGLNEVMAGEQQPTQFGENVLSFVAQFLDAQAGALYIKDEGDFSRIASYGVPASVTIPQHFSEDDGLLGQAVRNARPLFLRDVPDGYLWAGSALGKAVPRSLIIMPLKTEKKVIAVLELGFLQMPTDPVQDLLDYISEPLAIAVRSVNYRSRLQTLLQETQQQSEEVQVQSEELRAFNEELEEQGRALQESHHQMEEQQAGLEHSNTQLKEKAWLLQLSKDDLSNARSAIELKAQELSLASQYKSDFLANMSHELRTPLNSTLILARLLADNSEQNLTADQVRSAETIVSSGNDLLALINDILDLSKIEAGRTEVNRESVRLTSVMTSLEGALRPLAAQKGLNFLVTVTEDAPSEIETDTLRLEQVLKNLLSNAIKFTDEGTVSLTVMAAAHDYVAFQVHDTGIGIAAEQQEAIFEAFHQIDSAANRKYSGTGLGLSISRQLTQLLGGVLDLDSEPGVGSTFTLSVPRTHGELIRSEAPAPRKVSPLPRPSAARAGKTSTESTGDLRFCPPTIVDDREFINGDSRLILIVEDDGAFAEILCGLVRELNYQCLYAATAEEAMILVRQYLPSAVLLDVGLPDHSGLTVLDRLKQDVRTRHIPVHIIAANDYTPVAMALGAVSYILKPVTREKLIETLKNLELRLVARTRRVLVVEDDEVQRTSMQKLLSSREVETVGVSSAAECLEQLQKNIFDCMVLDLSLPDASGYALLETLSRENNYAFPPVIVYTGRDVSAEEELKLRRYSKSIIIKGAKSPERLLDEVTLFLHQVVADLPPEQQRMIKTARSRDATLEGRRVLIVEDDVRNVFALTSVLEPKGVRIEIARNGLEALKALEASQDDPKRKIDLVLMDVMMPEMDGLTATAEIRKRSEWRSLPVIMLTAKAMPDDQRRCLDAGANDYMAKPLDVDRLLSLVRVWIRHE